MLSLALIGLVAYLVGSFSTSLVVGRLHGIDIRRRGSGNAGATNVARVLGWKPALIVLLVDVAKGFLAVWLISRLRLGAVPWSDDEIRALAGLCAMAGHVWPVFSGFRGGKGVGTALGAVLAIDPLAALICLALFGAVLAVFRIVSLASITASMLLPVVLALERSASGQPVLDAVWGFGVGVAAMILLSHRRNIARLVSGEEPRLGSDE